MDAFYNYVEENRSRFLEELFILLKQKSISATGEGIEETLEILRSYMESSGIATRMIPTAGKPALYGEIIRSKELPTILIYGHYDVQPAEKEDGWETDPFEPVIKNGKIFCRGVSDDKGQLFTHVKAVETWENVYGDFPVNLKFIFEGEEEVGSPNLSALVKDNADLLQCDFVILSDSHIHESGRPVVILGLKGMLCVQLTMRGAERDLHSKFAASIESPVWRLLNLLSGLRDKEGKVCIDGFYEKIRAASTAEKECMDEIPYDKQQVMDNLRTKSLRSSEKYGDHYYWNMVFEPTCNIDGFLAGYTGDGSKTVLPKEAMAKIDFRLVPDQDPMEIFELLKKHLDKNGFSDVKVELHSVMKPCRTDPKDPYVVCIKEAIKAAWGEEPLLYPSIGGSGPNYIFTEHLKVPCITVPYAGADQNNHGVDENMSVKYFYNGIKTNGEIIRVIGSLGGQQ